MVDLPAPLGPMIAWIVRAATVKETSSRAMSAPNATVTSRISTAGRRCVPVSGATSAGRAHAVHLESVFGRVVDAGSRSAVGVVPPR